MENEAVQAHPLPSEKLEKFTPNRPADMEAQDFLLYLPKSKSGFTFKPENALTRGPQKYIDSLKEIIKNKTTGQIRFTHGHLAKEALDLYRPIPATEDDIKFQAEYVKVDGNSDEFSQKRAQKMIDEYIEKTGSEKIKAYKAYNEARKNYINRNTPKVGLRDLKLEGDKLSFDYQPIPYQVNEAIADMNSSVEDNERSVYSSTSGNVIFAPDKFGKRRIGVMIRNKDNTNWRDDPGTLIAGFFEGEIDPKASKLSPTQGHRTLKPVTNEDVFGNAFKELHEEVGLERSDAKKTIISALCIEKKKRPHHEILVDVELKLTADQAREKSKKHKINVEGEFEESWVDIEYSPEAIYTLLTQVESPLPIGHIGAFAATGRRLVAEKYGEKAATEWLRKVEIASNEHTQRMNAKVREYLRNNPEALTKPTPDQEKRININVAKYTEKNPQATAEDIEKYKQGLIDGRAKFDPEGFNPAILPEEQGLLDAKTALVRAGLVNLSEGKIVEFPQKEEMAKAA